MRARALIAWTIAALAMPAVVRAESGSDDQVVVVNAMTRQSSVGQVARLRRVLDQRKLLLKLPERLEATLDGRNATVADIDAIKDSYASSDYETALKMIEEDEARILREAVSRDPVPALAELAQWRGIIAAALDQQDEAMRWFRAAYRFNPAWTIDKKLASPRVRAIVKKARREVSATGTLRIHTDPDDALVSVDGGPTRPARDKLTLPIGMHLVTISAPRRKPYSELVEIEDGEPYRIDISLDPESTLDKAARLVDATAAAPAGKPRLKRARALGKLTGVTRMLFVEDGGDDHVTVRVYDLESKKVSRPLDLEGTASSAAIARKIIAALDPDNMVDVNTVVVTQRVYDRPAPTPWYGRWYVWAAIGAVAVGGYVSYDYMTREPTAVRGF
jgi:hypothetical protein